VDDPTTPIEPPRVPKKLPRPIDDDNLDVALQMADPRMRAWLSLACFEGFRCMEIAQLRREDIHDSHSPPLIRVIDGKGGKEAVLPLHPDVLDALRAYGMPESGPVFLSSRGRPFAPATVSGYVAEFLHGLGLHDTAHRLRDWFGTKVYAKDHDLRVTQEMMRHSDPSSTAGYVAFDNPSAVEAVTHLHV
jgi:integrase/recombinase XerC